ncbi:hypothetical protein Tco_1449186 [Tanacetum coccineum]
MFAVCASAKFQVTPKTSHLLAIKRIFRYLKGKPTLGLWYSRDSPFELVAYTDSDYVGATQDRKSTAGGCQFLGNRLISWQCKKQIVVATSTTEAEYVATANLLTKGFDAGRFQTLGLITKQYGWNGELKKNDLAAELTHPTVKRLNNVMITFPVIGQKVNTVSTNINAAMLPLVLLEGNLVFLITVKIFKALTSFIGAATTDIGLDVGQGSGIIHKTPTRLNDAPLLGVNTPGSAEGSLSQTELTDLVLKLSKKVEGLETDLRTQSRSMVKYIQVRMKLDFTAEDSFQTGNEDKKTLTYIAPGSVQLGVELLSKILAEQVKLITVAKDSFSVNSASDFSEQLKDSVNNVGDSILVKDKDPCQREGKAVMDVNEIIKKFKKGEYKQISRDEEVAQKLYAKELAKDTARQEQEKNDLEKALELQKQLDERVEVVAKVNQAHDIHWSDPAMLRYHALQNRSFSVAKIRKNTCTYLKNQGGYKQRHFKGMSYEDIRPIFESVWYQNHAFVPKDSEIEKEVMKRRGFDHQQESIKKNEKIKASGFVQKQPAGEEKEKKKDAESSKQVEEETVQQEDVVAEQVVKESSKKAGGRLKRKITKARDDKDKRQKM